MNNGSLGGLNIVSSSLGEMPEVRHRRQRGDCVSLVISRLAVTDMRKCSITFLQFNRLKIVERSYTALFLAKDSYDRRCPVSKSVRGAIRSLLNPSYLHVHWVAVRVRGRAYVK